MSEAKIDSSPVLNLTYSNESNLVGQIDPIGADRLSAAEVAENSSSVDGDYASSSKTSIFRPIQYLGSKLRALKVISNKVEEALPPGATVLDLFAGSTVVSQSLADRGFQLIASDAMRYTQCFATALLGIDRHLSSLGSDALNELVLDRKDHEKLSEPFTDWLSRERRALSEGEGAYLIELSKEFPQIWRDCNATEKVSKLFNELRTKVGHPGFSTSGIVTAHYASTYFGVEQAITIDSIRCSIEAAMSAGAIDAWSYNACITALLFSASKAAYTPGKHFAQYHKVSGEKSLEFHKRRILSDRAVNIEKEFLTALQEIHARPFREEASHRALHRSMEQLLEDPDELGEVDLIYADPPYTAQQYSRFYHLPEILSCYRVPELQLVSGKPTTGLYNSNRFKSRFSSKRLAPDAFRDLAALALAKECDLIVSYSESKSGVTGNSRMISLEELKRVFAESFSCVEVMELDLRYRQFNAGKSTVVNKEDRELMIYCQKC